MPILGRNVDALRTAAREVDQVADGVGRAERELLVGDTGRTRAAHVTAVGGQVAREDAEQRGLAAAVLADHGDAVTGGGDQVDPGEHGSTAEGEVDVGQADVRRAHEGRRKPGCHGRTASEEK